MYIDFMFLAEYAAHFTVDVFYIAIADVYFIHSSQVAVWQKNYKELSVSL